MHLREGVGAPRRPSAPSAADLFECFRNAKARKPIFFSKVLLIVDFVVFCVGVLLESCT